LAEIGVLNAFLHGADTQSMTSPKAVRWSTVVLVAVFAALTVLAADRVLQHFSKVHHLSEIEDALRQYAVSDPDVLVLGSSHARTFEVVDRELSSRSRNASRILSVPLEWGKLSGYEWVLQNRLRPLIEEKTSSGELKRQRLRRFILVTEWWDSTVDDEPTWNLPSRAWTWKHFLQDFAKNGLTEYNRNYLTTRWLRTAWGSVLAQDRGHGRILNDVKRRFIPEDPRSVEASFAFQTRKWQAMTEEGAAAIGSSTEMAALDRMLDYFQDRDIEIRIVLYPRKPGTLTEKAKATTLASFSDKIAKLAAVRGIRVHDWTLDSPIGDDDFLADFDHISEEGNTKLARWALEGDLSDLANPVSFVEDSALLEPHT
jgi:hypothetical protein